LRVLATLVIVVFLHIGQAIAEDSITYDAEQKALDYIALSYASAKGHIVLVKGLLARGAPVNPPSFSPDSFTDAEYLASQHGTPLQVAAEAGHADIVKLLLEHDANAEWQCCDGGTALYFAAENGHLEVVKALVEGGAKLLVFPSPLVAAMKGGHKDVVQYLNGSMPTDDDP